MTSVYIIRHAEAEGNYYRRAQGNYDSMITHNGARQIDALKNRFLSIHIDAVYSSNLTRAKLTAEAISKPKNLPLTTCENLREVCLGIWEDKSWGEIYRYWPQELADFTLNPERWAVDGCEPLPDAGTRLLNEIKLLAKKHEGQTIAVVTHGAALKSMLTIVYHDYLNIFDNTPGHCDNTGVTLLTFDDNDNISIVFEYDTAHTADLCIANPATCRKQLPYMGELWFRNISNNDKPYYSRFYDELITDRTQRLESYISGSIVGTDPAVYQFSDSSAIAMLGDEIAGIILLSHQKNTDIGEIELSYIVPEFRGFGLDLQLLGYAISVFRSKGLNKLRLFTCDETSFFKEHGFDITGNLAEKNISPPFDSHKQYF